MSGLQELAEQLVDQAGPAEQLEVYVARAREVQVRAYEGEVESLTAADQAGAGIRVVCDGRQGFAYAASLDHELLADALREARDNATFAEPDEHNGLVAPDAVAPESLELRDAAVARTSTEDKVALALELERAAHAADARLCGVESAEYVDVDAEVAVASTTGLRSYSSEAACYLAVYVLAADGDEMQTGFGFSLGRSPRSLDPQQAAADAARRATQQLGARKPPSSRTTVVLDPWVTAQFLEVLADTLDGESVLKGRSLFAQRLGEQVGATNLTLLDDPTELEAFGASAIDAEGLATRRNVLIDGGVLAGFVHNGYTARRSGVASTANAVRAGFRSTPGVGCTAVRLVPGLRDQAALLANVGDGVLVTDVAGIHSGVNPVSGDFSTGAEGRHIRGGEAAEPIREFTIASTLQRMLLDVREVGADLQWLPMGAAGCSLVIDDVTVSGA